MVRSQESLPRFEDVLRQFLAAFVVTPVIEVTDHVEDQVTYPWLLAADRLGYLHVGAQGRIALPVSDVHRIARVRRGEQFVCAMPVELMLIFRDPGQQDSLHQSVQLNSVSAVVDAGQGEALDIAKGPTEFDR